MTPLDDHDAAPAADPFARPMRLPKPGLIERVDSGEAVIHGSGYLFEMERRGFLSAGGFVPEVVLEFPEEVEALTREKVRAGSDVVLAFTYYGHREKMRLIAKEHLLEPLNRQALRIARRVQADFPDTLLAGNICNTNIYDPADPQTHDEVRAIFTEQLGWAKEGGAEMIVAETFHYLGEARIAAEVARSFDLPVVVGFAIHAEGMLRDGLSPAEGAKLLFEEAGADLVGANCHRGPGTMRPIIEDIVKAVPAHRVATWPVGYRTTPEQPTFGALTDPGLPEEAKPFVPGERPFPVALDHCQATRQEFQAFAAHVHALGVRYIGDCCGAGPHHTRAIAEGLGRTPPSSRYAPDLSKHYALGNDPSLRQNNTSFGKTRM